MVFVLNPVSSNDSLNAIGLATLLVLASGWVLQLRISNLRFDLVDELSLNWSRLMEMIFSRHQIMLFEAIDHWNHAIWSGALALRQLISDPIVLNSMSHPQQLELKFMLSNMTYSSLMVITKSQNCFHLMSRCVQPANIIHFPEYERALQTWHTKLELMQDTTLEALDTFSDIMHLLAN